MFRLIWAILSSCARLFHVRGNLLLENLALRQQLAVMKRRRSRPRLRLTPETVVCWHHAGFRIYWRWISRTRRHLGRTRISKEGRELICRMTVENPTWEAPRLHGESLMLGFDVTERTLSRWMRKAPRNPEPANAGWLSCIILIAIRVGLLAVPQFLRSTSQYTANPRDARFF